jgi:hypothetical protein
LGVLVALPPIIGALPARDSGVAAATLLAEIRTSGRVGYSGYAEAVGGLRLPLTDEFSGLADLFGDRTRLRVWWRGEDEWRVDEIGPTGETGLHRDQAGAWAWDYESNHATRLDEPSIRLPRAADLDPAQLGRRLLSEASLSEVSRAPARRIAGRDAPGVLLRPGDSRSTITSVEVWADPDTGVPLGVDVYGTGGGNPVVAASFLEFDPHPPARATTDFAPPASAGVSYGSDEADEVHLFGRIQPPAELAGYPVRRRVEGLGSVGTYGRGVTVLAAVPLSGQVSLSLRDELRHARGIRTTSSGLQLTVGPLSLLVTDDATYSRSWLLTGTVTVQTLERAAADLAEHPPGRR